uniref:SLOG family protein n=1 Tax=Pseudoclavibacter sp. RFBI5 TaxID=2080578 RepID=UPI001C66A48E|nr:SLOG family protein [Pseudoclavibacter sp. RFBI5]
MPIEHVAKVLHALADLTHQRHMLGPEVASLGSPGGVEFGGEFAHSLRRYFHGLGDELNRRLRQIERRFRILITGSRDWESRELIGAAITKASAFLNPDDFPVVIVHGGCPTGADLIADGIA